MSQNQIAYLDGERQPLRIADAEIPKAEADRIVVRNHAVAINPVDWKIQNPGLGIQNWPFVLGNDTAGEVVEVGSDVTRFKKGDRILAHATALRTHKIEDGPFALYTSISQSIAAVIPSNISYAEAAVIPLGLNTAAVGLYRDAKDGFIGLPYPSLKPSPSGKLVVVWGGSSSVGTMAIQLAVASGATVFATASPHNFDFCKQAGASQVFNYKEQSSIDELVNAVKSSKEEFAGLFDSISLDIPLTAGVVQRVGGGNLAVVLNPPKESPAADVRIGHIFAINPINYPVWADFVTPALESGVLKPLPPPEIIGKGLESLQKGLDANKKGVSAVKVVIEL